MQFGICTVINLSLSVNVRTYTNNSGTDGECLWLNVKRNHSKSITVGTMYRPPSTCHTYYDAMVDILDTITCEDDDVVLMGDLNYNYVYDETLSRNPINYIEQLTGLSQIITQPTRVTLTSSSLLDVILTTNPTHHIKTNVVPISMSDHYMLYTVINCKLVQTKEPITITVRNYKKFTQDNFKRDLYERMPDVQYRIINDHLNVNEAWSFWKDTFEQVCSVHAPLRTIRVRNRRNPLMTPDI